MKKLAPRRQLFVEEYLKDFNITKAAIRAGYSPKTAYSIGEEILKKPEVAAAIAAAKVERSDRTKIDANWVLQELASLYQECREKEQFVVALGSLEKLGKHTGVRAFSETENPGALVVLRVEYLEPKNRSS